MKRNRLIFALLTLVFITASSYTLARFYNLKTYVIRIDDRQYSPSAGNNALANAEVLEKSEKQPSEGKHEEDGVLMLSPQITFESDSPTSKQEELQLQEEGIYAVQLYGDALGEEHSTYLAGYLTYTAGKKLSYHLGTEEPIGELGEVAESDSTQELPKLSQLFQAEITDPIMQVESSEPSLNQKFITEIPEDSKLHELLSPKEERTTSKIVVTYLGSISETAQVEELNQTN